MFAGAAGRFRPALFVTTAAVVLAAVGCSSGSETAGTDPEPTESETVATTESEMTATTQTAPAARFVYPDAPRSPTADAPNPEADAAVDRIVVGLGSGVVDTGGVNELRDVADARHAWFLSDLLRFGGDADVIVPAFEDVTGVSIEADPDAARSPWVSVTNHLIAWDTPDYPGYREDKAGVFTRVEDGWEPFFSDADAEIDWRHLSWGGVFIDDRPLGDPNPCPGGCIPALDDPPTSAADGGSWYPDERVVFGIEVGGDALAIPLNIAEIHEMFNLTLGGRRLGIPYCTLCGSAQAYLTGDVGGVDGDVVLRTSGLLSRSNKVMYDLSTSSVFDTFTGDAVSGPLHDAGITLEQITVVRATWGEWKAEHPDTRIVAEDGGLGRSYDLDPLRGRDDDGPIFPVGDVDERLGVQEFVVGVIAVDGTPVAFGSQRANEVLAAGGTVARGGVELRQSGDGLVAVDVESGDPVPSHEAFWFAWSQFHPDTLLWER